VRYEDPSVIRPHEQTLDKPLADRTALLEAMRVDLEPVLLLSEDHGQLDSLLREDLQGQQPLVRHRDADGHHRYKVGQRFAAQHHAADGTAAAAKLAVVTSLDSPALTIDPIHRAFKEPIDVSRLADLPVAVEPFEGKSGHDFAAAVAAADTAGHPALGVWVLGRAPEVWRFDSHRLAVEIFQDEILSALGLPPEASTDGTVVYRSDPKELWSQVAAGDLGTGVWLPPMQPAAFAAAIADGQMLPAKSTRFLPKVMSGLVWADHDSKLL